MSKGSTQYVWRRCRGCGRVWRGMNTSKTCWQRDSNGSEKRLEVRYPSGKQKRIYCGTGRLIRYPERDEEVQQILKEMKQ